MNNKINIDRNIYILFMASLISCLVVYGFELTHFTMSIDEEYMNNYGQTIGLGRWGHAFIREYVLPEPFAPYFTTLLTLVFFSTSATVISLTIDATFTTKLLFSVLYVAIPQFAYQIEFANQSDTVALGVLASSASVYLFKRNNYKLNTIYSILIVALNVFAMSVYQSLSTLSISVFLVTILFDLYNKTISQKKAFLIFLKFLSLCLLSVITYQVITKIIQHTTGYVSGSYLSQNLHWFKEPVIVTASNVILAISSYFRGMSYYGLNIYALTGISIFIVIIDALIKKRIDFLYVIVMIILLLSPFAMIVAFGGNMPPRTLTSMSVSFSGAISFSLYIIAKDFISYTVCAIILLTGSATSSQLFYSDYMSYQSDKNIASQIISSIYRKYPEFNQKKNKIYFHGYYRVDNAWKKNADVFGRSFFVWDGGNNSRIINFMNSNNIANLTKVAPSNIEMMKNEAKIIPAWPNPNSVKMIGGNVLIKLGDAPGID
ncbi:glucosyltransferase domain-containing protein [Hafnia paralvei]|jgi:hypothetical protein|uniref:glucosyltransferase domain-containing protein n=1 Tax=Hafnia paralvei TaxID=546367 RepID=UPI003A0FD67E